jgi:tetratricopeptide (TPR) repeat protein
MSLTPAPTKVLEIFCSYAHEDERLRKALEKQMSLLKRDGLITEWHDHKISAGIAWENEILTHLNSAQIILLLISPDFIASDYCYSNEMQRAMERHESGEARVIPVILRPADWKSALFGKLKALPSDGKAITRWKNRDEAFLNVAKGIRRVVKELTSPTTSATKAASSLTSSSTPQQETLKIPAPYWNVPYKRNPFFTGREEILDQLYETFRERKGKAAKLPQALSGLGGVGKTQTAVEFAYRYRYEYEAVLWVRAESPDTLASDYITSAEILKLTERNMKDQRQIIDALKDWLNNNAHWLLILDNVEDLDMIGNFLPAENKGHILLTTRIQAMSGWAQRVTIETMEQQEGALLLLRRANIISQNALLDEVSDADLTRAEEISQSLGGLPLGLDQAGAYIEETNLGLPGYLELFQSQQRELLKRRGRQAAGHPEPVTATWSLSFAKVKQANTGAADLLRLCAYLYPDAIPEGIIRRELSDLSAGLRIIASDPIKLNEGIEELLKFSLVRRDPSARTLTVHRLVQTALREEMDEDTQRQWAERSVRAVNRAFPEVEFATWSLCQQYLPHAHISRALIEQWNIEFLEAAELLYKIGYYLWDRSQYVEAELFLQNTLTIREKLLGLEDSEVAQTLNLLGVICLKLDKYAQAESLLQRALTIREKILDQEDPKVAESLHDLGMIYLDLGKVLEAESLMQRAVAIREKVLGLEHLDTARSLGCLANIYGAQARYSQSEQLELQVLAIRVKLLGEEHPEIATSLNSLSMSKANLGDLSEAERLERQALAIREKLLGQENIDTAECFDNLAFILYRQGKYIQAKSHSQRALRIVEKALGSKHHRVAECLVTLALISHAQHNNSKAEQLYQRALAIREKAQGLEHFEVADILRNLGDLYSEERKYSKAEPFYQRAVKIYEKSFGEGDPHPTLAEILMDYALLLRRTKHTAEAIDLEERAGAIRTQHAQEITTDS